MSPARPLPRRSLENPAFRGHIAGLEGNAALNRALHSQSDSAADVAGEIVAALVRNARELHIGFPERFFAWLNGFAPGVIDRGLAGKLPIVKLHANSR